ncbi:MAG: ABC transporter permease [Rhizobiales bacterium]|nr:ABC transporter permease [Hyphomicrobiales bacterium]
MRLGAMLGRNPAVLAGLLFLALLVASIVQDPIILSPRFLAGAASVAVPLLIGAMAVTPAILSGNGGMDLSVGPLMGFVNVLVVVAIMPAGLEAPWLAVPLLLAVGLAVGAANGWLVAVVRLQPIVATLGTYLILMGANLWLLPTPIGPVPQWLAKLSRPILGVPGPLVFVVGPVLVWFLLGRTPFLRTLLAVGGDDRVAYSAGIDVTRVRILAYAVGGLFAAFAGLALTSLIQSADANVGAPFTLQVITAAALGGISLAGGRGSMWGSVFGALSLFLLQNFLTNQGVSVFWQQVAFGLTLIAALILNAAVARLANGRALR